jgi:hypothetical protein
MKKHKDNYQSPESLRTKLKRALENEKFKLDCGHCITFNHVLGNNVVIINGKELKIPVSSYTFRILNGLLLQSS